MPTRSTVLSVLLLSADPDLQAQIKQDLKDVAITATKDLVTASRAVARRTFDVLILETRRGSPADLTEVQRAVDPARTCILAGPRPALRRVLGALRDMMGDHGRSVNGGAPGASLEHSIESKIGDFVKDMKDGAARNLHPMLIKAVERPLIAHTLKETNGNQIQAAHLLGMNRNTLRKKITELRIPVRRERTRPS
jgi:two-component system nitrogen regulation response regulator GlnG